MQKTLASEQRHACQSTWETHVQCTEYSPFLTKAAPPGKRLMHSYKDLAPKFKDLIISLVKLKWKAIRFTYKTLYMTTSGEISPHN